MFTDPFAIDKFFSTIGELPSHEILSAAADQRRELIDISFWDHHRSRVADQWLPQGPDVRRSYGDTVTIEGTWRSGDDQASFEAMLYDLRPWRKGPFSLLGTDVDTEWRSFLKWTRIAPHLPRLRDAVVGDIGCNNGYYMFRLLEHSPRAVLGLDPNARFFYQFDLLHRLFRPSNLFYEPLGVEHVALLPECFDVMFCLGVIYHRRDPHSMLRELLGALKPGGTLFLEGLTVPKEFSDCLIPASRYAMMRNVWAVPSPQTLFAWVADAGFRDVQELDTSVTTTHEQRKTAFAHFDSLADFLDPNESSKTVEGYPAPRRTIIKAMR